MSTKRFQITKEIYLNATEVGSKINSKKIAAKPSDPGTFKAKRYPGQHSTPNSKEPMVSNNNSINTTIMKNKTNSYSHFINGNESTLPLSGQYDNSSKEGDPKSSEKLKTDKSQTKNCILPVQDAQEKDNNAISGITLVIKRKDDEISALRTNNQSIRAELSSLMSCLNKERSLIAELTERNRSAAVQEKKLARATESLQLIKGFQIQLADEPINSNSELLKEELSSGRQSPYRDKKVPTLKALKKPMKMEINLPTPNPTPEPNEMAQCRNQFNFPRSSVSSARGLAFKENNHFSSSRNTPRTNIGERSSSSNILLRKLSDQSSEYYTNQTFNSASSPFESKPLRLGIRSLKQRSFKVSRVINSKKGSRQSLEGSTSIGADNSLQPDDSELIQHKVTNSRLEVNKIKSNDTIAKLLGGIKKKISKVLDQYDQCEKRELAKKKHLKNILKEKLSGQGAQKQK